MNWVSSFRRLLSTKPPVHERRQYPRYKMSFAVTIEARGTRLHARCADLSETGIGIYLVADLDIGEQVTLQYELGDGSPRKTLFAIVRNRTGPRYGLEFVRF